MADETPGVDVLNCNAGHLKIHFDKSDKDDVEKARKVIMDMLGRGYMIFVKVDGDQKRVREFDVETNEYILEEPDVIKAPEEQVSAEIEPKPPAITEGSKRGPGRPKGRRVPMQSARATGIGPTAGG